MSYLSGRLSYLRCYSSNLKSQQKVQLAIDIGNSRTKVGFFDQMRLHQMDSFDRSEDIVPFLEQKDYRSIIYSSVLNETEALHSKLRELGGIQLDVELATTCLVIKYQLPRTLGSDRIAAGSRCSLPTAYEQLFGD